MSCGGDSFSGWLRERNRATWDAMVGHRFCRDMAVDALPEAALVRYLRFEHAFVRAAIRTFAYALAKAEEADDQDRLVATLQGLAGEQDAYFRQTFASLGRDGRPITEAELPPAARNLRDGVLAIAASEPLPEILAAMAAAEWMYLTWCEAAEARQPRREAEAAWLALHTAGPCRPCAGSAAPRSSARSSRLRSRSTTRPSAAERLLPSFAAGRERWGSTR